MSHKNRRRASEGLGSKFLAGGHTTHGNVVAKTKWLSILPSARKKLVDAGLFNSDGTITEAGLKKLSDAHGQSGPQKEG